jgi:deazaflavin-dependent oxidoreductase (nitroreductase family)
MADGKSFNEQVIEEFRANGGVVGGPFAGRSMMLLTTTGAKSGEPRTHPLVYTTDGDRMVIIASKGGADDNPAWYHNLKTNPLVTVEVGTDTYQAAALVTEGDERKRLFDQQAAVMPGFADYERKTARVIPVVVLEPVTA